MRLLVTGPKRFEDFAYIQKVLNYLTFQVDQLTLVSNLEPGREYHLEPSSFPQAEKWLTIIRRKGRKLYDKIIRFHAPYSGSKQWSLGVRVMRREMVENAQGVVAFWELGGDNNHTDEILTLARFHDLPVKLLRV